MRKSTILKYSLYRWEKWDPGGQLIKVSQAKRRHRKPRAHLWGYDPIFLIYSRWRACRTRTVDGKARFVTIGALKIKKKWQCFSEMESKYISPWGQEMENRSPSLLVHSYTFSQGCQEGWRCFALSVCAFNFCCCFFCKGKDAEGGLGS